MGYSDTSDLKWVGSFSSIPSGSHAKVFVGAVAKPLAGAWPCSQHDRAAQPQDYWRLTASPTNVPLEIHCPWPLHLKDDMTGRELCLDMLCRGAKVQECLSLDVKWSYNPLAAFLFVVVRDRAKATSICEAAWRLKWIQSG